MVLNLARGEMLILDQAELLSMDTLTRDLPSLCGLQEQVGL